MKGVLRGDVSNMKDVEKCVVLNLNIFIFVPTKVISSFVQSKFAFLCTIKVVFTFVQSKYVVPFVQ